MIFHCILKPSDVFTWHVGEFECLCAKNHRATVVEAMPLKLIVIVFKLACGGTEHLPAITVTHKLFEWSSLAEDHDD